MTETLLQELISGSTRRNTFSPNELLLLLDLEDSNVRRSARPAILKRYEAALRRRPQPDELPLRLADFVRQERLRRTAHRLPASPGLSSE